MIDDRKQANKEKIPSNKEFGFVFAVFFSLIAFIPLLKHHPIRWWALGVAMIFLSITFIAPRALAPLAKIWMKFGFLLHRVMSPIILGAVYFFVFSPFGLVLRAFGMKFLKLEWDKKVKSYWIERAPPGPDQMSFKNQF